MDVYNISILLRYNMQGLKLTLSYNSGQRLKIFLSIKLREEREMPSAYFIIVDVSWQDRGRMKNNK